MKCLTILENMPLDRLVEIIVKEANKVPNNVIIDNGADKEPAEFLWGVTYTRKILSNPTSQLTEIQLIYEGNVSKEPYLVRPNSLDELKLDSRTYGVKDYRFLLFGDGKFAITLYKAFFELLNEDRTKDIINDEKYMAVFIRFRERFIKMWSEIVNNPNSGTDGSKRRFVEEFKSDSLLIPYIKRANSRAYGGLHQAMF